MRGQRRYGTVTATSTTKTSSTTSTTATSLRVSTTDNSSDPASLLTAGTTAPQSPVILDGPHPRPRQQTQAGAAATATEEAEREPLLSGKGSNGGIGACDRWLIRPPGLDQEVGGNGAFDRGSARRDNSRILTTILVLNYMIGSGILNSAQVFSESGVAAATVLYIAAAAAIWFGMVVLILAAESAFPRGERGDSGILANLDFADLAGKTLGRHGATTVDLSIVVGNFGDVCSYVILVGSLSASLLKEWIGGDGAWTSFSVVTPVMVVFLVYPPCLIRHFSNLRWLSALCLLAIAAVVSLVVVGAPRYAEEYRSERNHDPGLDAAVVYWDWLGSVGKLGSIVFALSCSVAALHAYTAMYPRSERAWRSVAAWAVSVGLVLCYSTGLVGYLSFRDATDGDILDNFEGALASCFKALVVIHLVLYIPSEVVVLRHSLFAMCGRDVMESEFWPVAWVTLAVLGAITVAMVSFEAIGIAEGDLFGYILDLTGGFTGSLTSFILPGLVFLGATREEAFTTRGYGAGHRSRFTYYRMGCQALVLFGVVVMIIVPIGVILDIVENIS